jgi:hypothetical protein
VQTPSSATPDRSAARDATPIHHKLCIALAVAVVAAIAIWSVSSGGAGAPVSGPPRGEQARGVGSWALPE